jgi:hypothetical protein
MPRTFYTSVETLIDGRRIWSSNNQSYTCRDVAIGAVRCAIINSAVWNYIRPFAPTAVQETVPANVETGIHNEEVFRATLGTFLRNRHRFRFHLTVMVPGVSAEAVAYVVGKLHEKYTDVEFRLEDRTSKLFGRNTPEVTLHLTGTDSAVAAWWWSVLLLRLSAENTKWIDVTRLIDKTQDVSNGIGPGGRENTLRAWRNCVNRQEVAGYVMMFIGMGPIQAMNGEGRQRIAAAEAEIGRRYRQYAWDITPPAERPARVEVPVREKPAKQAAPAETVRSEDQPVAVSA